MLLNLFGASNQGGARGPKRVGICARLTYKEAALWVGSQVLGMHGHTADEEYGASQRIECERHERAEGKARVFLGERRQSADRGQREQGTNTLGVAWFGQLRQGWAGVSVLAACVGFVR